MRQKRAKAYRKLMRLYCQSFGFREPYQVLIDSTTCETSISLKFDILEQLGNVLQGQIKPMITQCSIHELYLQGKSQQAATDLAKTFERRKCNHKEAIPGNECLIDVVGDKNKHRYVIATQSRSLRVQLRTVPATPLVHINRSVMVLEPPSDLTLQMKAAAEEKLLLATGSDKNLIPGPNPEPLRKKHKGPKGPNPLSVKKKANPPTLSKSGGISKVTKAGTKRKRDESEDSLENADSVTSLMGLCPPQKKRKRKRKSKSLVYIMEGLHDETNGDTV